MSSMYFLLESVDGAAAAVTEAAVTGQLSLGDKASLSLQMLVLGMGTVFAVLIILMFALELFKVFFGRDRSQKSARADTAQSPQPAPVAEEPQTAGDSELIAAITAAITAFRASAGVASDITDTGFRVVSFKRKNDRGTDSPWNKIYR